MRQFFSFICLSLVAAMAFVASFAARAVDYALALIPALTSAGDRFNFGKSHPRSPLASLRAGLA